MSKANKVNGTIVDLPQGAKIHCPEDGGRIQQPVTLEVGDSQAVFHDVRSLINTMLMTLGPSLGGRKQGGGKQGSGPERMWQDAEEYMDKHNAGKPPSEHITKDQARRILADEKRRKKAEALLKPKRKK